MKGWHPTRPQNSHSPTTPNALNQVLALDANQVDAYNNRGNAHLAKGELEAARADSSRAITINLSHAVAYFNRGTVLFLRGIAIDSEKDLEQAAELNPGLPDSVRKLKAVGDKSARRHIDGHSPLELTHPEGACFVLMLPSFGLYLEPWRACSVHDLKSRGHVLVHLA